MSEGLEVNPASQESSIQPQAQEIQASDTAQLLAGYKKLLSESEARLLEHFTLNFKCCLPDTEHGQAKLVREVVLVRPHIPIKQRLRRRMARMRRDRTKELGFDNWDEPLNLSRKMSLRLSMESSVRSLVRRSNTTLNEKSSQKRQDSVKPDSVPMEDDPLIQITDDGEIQEHDDLELNEDV